MNDERITILFTTDSLALSFFREREREREREHDSDLSIVLLLYRSTVRMRYRLVMAHADFTKPFFMYGDEIKSNLLQLLLKTETFSSNLLIRVCFQIAWTTSFTIHGRRKKLSTHPQLQRRTETRDDVVVDVGRSTCRKPCNIHAQHHIGVLFLQGSS